MGMKSRVSLLFLVALFLFSEIAHSDGMAFKGQYWSSLAPIAQGEQKAVIIHRDGIQRMIIAINFEAEDEDNSLWIFPVPGTPDETKAALLDSFPRFGGLDLRDSAASKITEMKTWLGATQIWPIGLRIMAPSLLSGKDVSVHAERDEVESRLRTISGFLIKTAGKQAD